MHGSVRDITPSAYRACKSACQATVLDTSAILDIVGPALANSMPLWYLDLANAMRAHMTMSGGMVPGCAVSTFSSTDSLNAFVNLHVSYVVGERTFSNHDWVNELDTVGDHIADIMEIESHALVSKIASYKNLGDGDKQTEDDDDETAIDLKEYTCVENILLHWDDNAGSPMSECRLVET